MVMNEGLLVWYWGGLRRVEDRLIRGADCLRVESV